MLFLPPGPLGSKLFLAASVTCRGAVITGTSALQREVLIFRGRISVHFLSFFFLPQAKKMHNSFVKQVGRSKSEKERATHSSTLAWAEEPGGLQSMGSLRVGHD